MCNMAGTVRRKRIGHVDFNDFRTCLLKQIDFRYGATTSNNWTGPGSAFQGGAAGIPTRAASNITVECIADEKEENGSKRMRYMTAACSNLMGMERAFILLTVC